MSRVQRALAERGQRAAEFYALRDANPTVPARQLWHYVISDRDQSLQEFLCPGHEWAYTGTAYGGEDERWSGEGRCYCVHCGADGDA